MTRFRNLLNSVVAVAVALVLGAVVLWASGYDVGAALSSLAMGAVGSVNANAETLLEATPLLLGSLAVAVGLRAGLFNIGVEGQILMGGLFSAVVGYQFTDRKLGPAWHLFHAQHVPGIVQTVLILAAGVLGGTLWAGLAGLLKARFGAHEVITTIMLNYVAMQLVSFLVRSPLHGPGPIPETPWISHAARLPLLIPDTRLHAGLLLALAAAGLVWFFLWKTPGGFAIRTVGLNPDAAQYAGISMRRTIVGTLALSGALAGLAGGVQIAGVNFRLVQTGFSSGFGYDSIAISLLGLNHPLGIILAAWLFAALRSGAGQMQVVAGVSSQIISVLQALVILMVSAEAGIRYYSDMRKKKALTTAAPPPIEQSVPPPAASLAPAAQSGPAQQSEGNS